MDPRTAASLGETKKPRMGHVPATVEYLTSPVVTEIWCLWISSLRARRQFWTSPRRVTLRTLFPVRD